jgi:hypothetical protein
LQLVVLRDHLLQQGAFVLKVVPQGDLGGIAAAGLAAAGFAAAGFVGIAAAGGGSVASPASPPPPQAAIDRHIISASRRARVFFIQFSSLLK